MIKLEVQDYCSDCDDFYARVEKSGVICVGDTHVHNTTITCKNQLRCRSIYKFLKNGGKQQELPPIIF